jgi:hypothetical protein
MLGRETAMKAQGGKLVAKASTGPCYFITGDKLRGVARIKEFSEATPAGYFPASVMELLFKDIAIQAE